MREVPGGICDGAQRLEARAPWISGSGLRRLRALEPTDFPALTRLRPTNPWAESPTFEPRARNANLANNPEVPLRLTRKAASMVMRPLGLCGE